MSRYKELLAQTAKELDGFQALTRLEIEQASRVGINLGAQNARSLLSYAASGSPAITGSFNRLPAVVIEQMLGFLSPDGPLYMRLGKLGEVTAAALRITW